ncbi:helix-turn-helix transcriptional regulator [Halomonas sp. M4R5S39]|uniref:helix-turn-helix transcriptional regulator n=1 Tax=Halomonas kalidii TaxID=3043293 RepID=UPI0024A88D61|nr:helix-turn-helix transcriptional regulator [Halomonas kalidii]MDI5983904.1 helix-turn-helix transcriptional regulator [Halomonas kalidii]
MNNNSKARNPRLDENDLKCFSREVLKLSELSEDSSAESWLHEAILIFSNVVSFDSAWWGQVYIPTDNSPPKNLMHGSHGLSASFAEEWNGISGIDCYANTSISCLGRAVRDNNNEASKGGNEEVEAFCKRHDIFHSMAVTQEFPSSGMLFFVSINRGNSGVGFDDAESILMEEFFNHLTCCWRAHLSTIRSDGLPSVWDSYALASMQGKLLYIGRDVGTALSEKYAGWQGSSLPDSISSLESRVPCTMYPDGKQGIIVQQCGDLVSLVLSSRQQSSSLSPRELSAARLYSLGNSYKEVARALGVTPATARTYLRSAYIRLGVSNKVELISALRQPGSS